MDAVSSTARRAPFLVYTILTLVLGWLPWYLFGQPVGIFFMPFLTALLVAWLTEGRQGLKPILQRALRWRAERRIYFFVLLSPAVLGRTAVAINGVLVNYKKGRKTALHDGDLVSFVKAAAGG